MLQALGANVLDADAVSRAATVCGGDAIDSVREAFGDAAIASDGSLDRAAMRELVFANPEAKRQLEAIIHPIVGRNLAALAAQNTCDLLVFDVPLLVESGRWRTQVDLILVVDCLAQTQIDRVLARSGMCAEVTRSIMATQASRRERLAVADCVIYNDGIDKEALAQLVSALARQWRAV